MRDSSGQGEIPYRRCTFRIKGLSEFLSSGRQVRDPLRRLNRCDSGTDSIVWMREEALHNQCVHYAPDLADPGIFYAQGRIRKSAAAAACAPRGEQGRSIPHSIQWNLLSVERRTTMKTTTAARNTAMSSGLRTRVSVGMLSAISVILMLFEFPLPFIAPSFYELDFSEVPILVGAFALGPVAGVMAELIKILLNLVINGTDTAFVGEFANFIFGCAFVVPAALIYKAKKSRRNAVLGLAAGTIAMTIAGLFINALVLLPAYSKAFGMPIEVFIEMGTAINPGINGVWTFVLLAVAPFNIVKGFLVSVITILLYKHISPILKGSR